MRQHQIVNVARIVFMLKAKAIPTAVFPPKTAFADLPDDWKCPFCGAAKSQFELLED